MIYICFQVLLEIIVVDFFFSSSFNTMTQTDHRISRTQKQEKMQILRYESLGFKI